MLMRGEPVERRAVWVAGRVAALETGVLRVVVGEKRTGTGRGVKRSLHRDLVILETAKSCFGHSIRQWHLLAWSKVSCEVADVAAQKEECARCRSGEGTHMSGPVSWSVQKIQRPVAYILCQRVRLVMPQTLLTIEVVCWIWSDLQLIVYLNALAVFKVRRIQSRIRIGGIARKRARAFPIAEVSRRRKQIRAARMIPMAVRPDNIVCT